MGICFAIMVTGYRFTVDSYQVRVLWLRIREIALEQG